MQVLYIVGSIAGGIGLATLAIWAAWHYSRGVKSAEPVELEIVEEHPARFVPAKPAPVAPPARAQAPPPPPATPRAHAEKAPAMVLTQGVAMQDANFTRGPQRAAPAPPPARPPMRQPPAPKSWAQQVMESTPGDVATEWARRQVGPVEPGRTSGACGGCGARLSVSEARPLRIACPVCGRTKLLAA